MKKSKLIFFNIILIFAICILNFFNINSKSYINNDLIIHYIDVGQGDCILIQVNNKNLLIDSGPSSNRDDLLNYLQKLNIDKFDYIIATHPHEDHIGNMDTIIKRFNVSNFYAPKIINTSISFENMISALVDKSLKVKVLKSGTNTINLGLNTKVEVFSPEENIVSDNFNDYSSVIKISFLNTSFLFTGDAENFTEDYLISSTSSSLKFLKAVNPSVAIISVGNNNTYGHPSLQTLTSLKNMNIDTYRTDLNGTIILSSNGNIINITLSSK